MLRSGTLRASLLSRLLQMNKPPAGREKLEKPLTPDSMQRSERSTSSPGKSQSPVVWKRTRGRVGGATGAVPHDAPLLRNAARLTFTRLVSPDVGMEMMRVLHAGDPTLGGISRQD